MSVDSLVAEMRSKADPRAVAGMARFGISSKGTFGVSMPALREMARRVGKDHSLALGLWDAGYHEARILAALVDDPEAVSDDQMERWVRDFDSWDVCDQCCGSLFDKTKLAYLKATDWSRRGEEFVKRAGYVLMAELAVHDKKAPDSEFLQFLPIIEEGSSDPRNYVKKAISWALRQIGKRNLKLNREALKAARRISKGDGPNSRWAASDAIRELESGPVQRKVRRSS